LLLLLLLSWSLPTLLLFLWPELSAVVLLR
jgi:hypothetical protein